MKPIIKIISLILTIVLLLPLTSCDDTNDAYIYFQLDEVPRTLDPQTAQTDIELLLCQNLYEGLMRFDSEGKLVCAVAESYQKQGLTYTFKISNKAEWKNGDKITANDFVFAFKRALSADTKSPYSSLLFSIKNAQSFLQGKSTDLGVTAVDNQTLKIELSYDDKSFLEILTYPIAMPCNEPFFIECKGKYGLDTDFILSNGSYRLTKWGKDIFGIRLYRSKYYNGNFTAKNAAVFISCDEKLTAYEVLNNGDADIAFLSANDAATLDNQKFNSASINNTIWFLTLSNDLPQPIRKAFSILASGEVFGNNLGYGASVANSIFPLGLNVETDATGTLPYNLDAAKQLYSEAIVTMENKKLPADLKLYYYDNGFSKNMVTSIVGHWQNNLGAYINIESVSSPELLADQLNNQSYYMSIFPITAQNPSVTEYLSKFGINYDNGDLNTIQVDVLSGNNIVPLAYESKIISFSNLLENVNYRHGGGALDLAFVIKNND